MSSITPFISTGLRTRVARRRAIFGAALALSLLGGCVAQPLGPNRLPDAAAGQVPAKAAISRSPPASTETRSPAERAAAAEGRTTGAVAPSGNAPTAETGSAAQGATRNVLGARVPVTIRVAPDGDAATIAQAARLARDGDTVEVQAGEYRGDVATWPQKRLTIRAVGGRARLIADGKAAQGMGIWVIPNGEFLIEGFDFEGARVSDRNGAGIRFHRGKLIVRDSRFIDNENGILTGSDSGSELVIDRCMFSGNGYGDGQSHNLYVGKIGHLVVRGSYFRKAKVGHLLKSRARISDVSYNRLTDEKSGSASYELEFPSGGRVTAIGNLIEQSAGTENSTIVSYGAEGYTWPENTLAFVHNTVVNRREAGGVFVRVKAGDARVLLANNLFVGKGSLQIDAPLRDVGNFTPSLTAFVNPDSYDFRPKADAPFIGRAVDPSGDGWPDYQMTHRYVHERRLEPLAAGRAATPGAFQP